MSKIYLPLTSKEVVVDRAKRRSPKVKDKPCVVSLVAFSMQPLTQGLTFQLDFSFLQAKLNSATIQDLLDANKLLHDAKVHKSTRIKIKSIPLKDVRFLSFSDASFATRSNAQSQKGCLILTASEAIGEWKSSDVSPIFWYSKKIARVVPSTLASEAYALSGALDVLSWLRLQWDWINSPSDRWKDPLNCLQQCPVAYAVVDCKSLYDLLQKTIVPQCQEYRTTLESPHHQR